MALFTLVNVPPADIPGPPQISPPRRWQTMGHPIFSEILAFDNELFIIIQDLERTADTPNARMDASQGWNDPSFYDAGAVSIVDEDKANTADTALVLLIGLIVLIVPIWVLEFPAKDLKAKLGVIRALLPCSCLVFRGSRRGSRTRHLLPMLHKLRMMICCFANANIS